jgi:diguanylate cyclase (GGDEF)-like protein/PAS domain S-box-containing protein
MIEHSTVFEHLEDQTWGYDDWYELIAEASADGVWFWDVDRDAVHCTPRLKELLNLPPATKALNSQEALALVHPDDRDRYGKALTRYLKGEAALLEVEVRPLNNQGDIRWILNRGVGRRDEQGRAYCMLGVVVDVTRRRQLEESLRAVALSTGEPVGTDGGTGFFESLVRYLSEALGSDLALVGKLEGGKMDHVDTVAVYRDGAVQSNFRYDLAHTPCENVILRKACVYPSETARLFPKDRILVDERIEAYIGAPLCNSSGRPIGIIAALFREPLSETSNAEYLLRIFASRAAAELERQDKVEALRASEQKFRDFTEVAADIVWETDPGLRFTYFNEQAFERLALAPGALLGRTPWELVTPDDAMDAGCRDCRNRLEKRIPIRDFVFALKDGHGARRFMRMSGRPMFDTAGGQFLGYRGVATEITEQRRAEAEFRDIFNSASEGIYRSTPEGRFLRVNPALVRMQGFETEAELIDAISDLATDWFVNPADRDRFTGQLDREGRVDNFEFQVYRRATGEKIWVRESAHVVYDDNGDIAYYEGMVYEITDEYQARERALRRNAVLEMIARHAPIGEVLNEILRTTETGGGNQTAAIFRQRDGRLYSTTSPGLKQACLETIDGKTPPEVGGAIQAALSGERQVVEVRLDAGDRDTDFAGAMRSSGYLHGLATPIRDQKGVVLGALAVFDANGGTPNQASIAALRETAHIASIAIEQDRLSEELRQQAHYDPLTGLPNRTLLADRLDQALREAARGDYPVGVLLLDLDEFKQVNDTFGHPVGDELLREVAAHLGDCLRSGDTVARQGGDEFVVVVPLKNGAGYCTDVAERLLQAVRAPLRLSEGEVGTNASIGIGLYPQDGETSDSLLQAADAAMYAAKKAGKNQYRYYAENMNRQASGRVKLESELRKGLESDKLDLYYQPRVALDSGDLCGAEALLRWHHPDRGLLDAKEFIGIAERRSLMNKIGRFVSHRAVERLAAWQREGRSLVLSFNVSARELHDGDFVSRITRMIEEAGANPAGLELEISESILAHDSERTCRQLLELKKRMPDLRIAIDNFGSGNSSLDVLRRLPIDTLKIDRRLISQLNDADGAKVAAIAQALSDLGYKLGFVVVAEGLENEQQAKRLRDFGCHQAQGFLYDPALPQEEFEQRLKTAKGRST